jgi:hypothetical protein
MSGSLDKSTLKLLNKGPNFIPKVRSDVNKALTANKDAGWLTNPAQTVRSFPPTTDELTLNTVKKLDVIIKKSDKGSVFVAMSRDQYTEMANHQLSKSVYAPADQKTHDLFKFEISSRIDIINHYDKKYAEAKTRLGPKLKIRTAPEVCRTRSLYFQPKIHKKFRDTPIGPIPVGRPILDSYKTEYSDLDKAYMYTIKPLLNHCNTVAQGTLEVVLKLRTFFNKSAKKFNNNNPPIFVSFDVVDLYTNIPVNTALDLARDLMIKHQLVKEKSTAIQITEIMKRIFSYNTFLFGKEHLVQTDGCPMGASCSGLLANIYLFHLFKDTLDLFKDSLHFYCRYLDDGFLITDTTEHATQLISVLSSLHPSIELTHEISTKQAIFLDIFLKYQNNEFYMSTYTKETSNMQLIHFHSQHPYKLKKSVVIARLLHYIRLSTHESGFYSATYSLFRALRKQQYPRTFLRACFFDFTEKIKNQKWPFLSAPKSRPLLNAIDEYSDSIGSGSSKELYIIRKTQPGKKRKIAYVKYICNRAIRPNGPTTHVHADHKTNILQAKSYAPSLKKLLCKSNHAPRVNPD